MEFEYLSWFDHNFLVAKSAICFLLVKYLLVVVKNHQNSPENPSESDLKSAYVPCFTHHVPYFSMVYPLVNVYITMENHHFLWVCISTINGHVQELCNKLPEVTSPFLVVFHHHFGFSSPFLLVKLCNKSPFCWLNPMKPPLNHHFPMGFSWFSHHFGLHPRSPPRTSSTAWPLPRLRKTLPSLATEKQDSSPRNGHSRH